MSATLLRTLHEAAVATFEQLVFLLPDVPPDEIQRRQPVRAIATVAFSGPARGVLQIHACEGLLPRLTTNMMGTDGASETLQLDALGEIANIICGQILPALDPMCAFEQQPPEVVAAAVAVRGPTAVPAARLELGVEQTRADLLLFVFPAIAPEGTP